MMRSRRRRGKRRRRTQIQRGNLVVVSAANGNLGFPKARDDPVRSRFGI